MKKFLKWASIMSVCAVIFSMAMVSCSDDDDEKSNNYSEMIIGTWSETGEWDGSYDGYDYGYIFRHNGTVTEFGSGRYDGTYRISGNKLIIQDDYDEGVYIIKSLTEKKLVLGYEDEDEYETDVYYRVSDH